MPRYRIAFLFTLLILFSATTQAGEVIVKLPEIQAEGVVSLHRSDNRPALSNSSKTEVLHQKGRMFRPHFMIIPVGSTVDMTNDDDVYHNIFSFSPAKPFDLGLYPHGDHKSVLFDQSGEVKIFCAVHPEMHATILVLDTPWFVHTQGKKEVRLDNIPSGLYTVRLWQENKATEFRSNIEIGKRGISHVDFSQPDQATQP